MMAAPDPTSLGSLFVLLLTCISNGCQRSFD